MQGSDSSSLAFGICYASALIQNWCRASNAGFGRNFVRQAVKLCVCKRDVDTASAW
jgi:hypothetical protein